jgi:hypothetical protein
MRPAGFEPATPGLGNRCSILLSYERSSSTNAASTTTAVITVSPGRPCLRQRMQRGLRNRLGRAHTPGGPGHYTPRSIDGQGGRAAAGPRGRRLSAGIGATSYQVQSQNADWLKWSVTAIRSAARAPDKSGFHSARGLEEGVSAYSYRIRYHPVLAGSRNRRGTNSRISRPRGLMITC